MKIVKFHNPSLACIYVLQNITRITFYENEYMIEFVSGDQECVMFKPEERETLIEFWINNFREG